MATARPGPRIREIGRTRRRVGSGSLIHPVKARRRSRGVSGFGYADETWPRGSIGALRVLIVEDEPFMAEAIRDGLRLEAIAADIAGDGDAALDLLGVNAYDIAVLDRDIPGPSGDEVARRVVASGSGTPIL